MQFISIEQAGVHIVQPLIWILAYLFLLGLGLDLEAADLLLGQRRSVLLLLGRPQPELQVGHLPLQLHDPGALRHRGDLQHNRGSGRVRTKTSRHIISLRTDNMFSLTTRLYSNKLFTTFSKKPDKQNHNSLFIYDVNCCPVATDVTRVVNYWATVILCWVVHFN